MVSQQLEGVHKYFNYYNATNCSSSRHLGKEWRACTVKFNCNNKVVVHPFVSGSCGCTCYNVYS